MRFLPRGLPKAEVAETLFLNESTVKTRVAAMLDKLGLRDRVQAAIPAYERGLVRPGQATAQQRDRNPSTVRTWLSSRR